MRASCLLGSILKRDLGEGVLPESRWPEGPRSIHRSVWACAYPVRAERGTGVDIFFVLSGFLITSILSTEIERFGQLQLRNFYVRRMLRLFPALAVTTALFCLLTTLELHAFPTQTALIAITHSANWARAVFNVPLSQLEHFWSLASEEQFYLFWPLVVLLLERMVPGSLRKALVLLVLFVALDVYRYVMVGTFTSGRIYFALDTHMDGLVLGSALSYLLRPRTLERVHDGFRHVLSWIIVPVALGGLVFLIHFVPRQSHVMQAYGFTLTAIAAAVLLTDLVAGARSPLRAVLRLPPIVYIGRISYGIYLFHLIVYHWIDRLAPRASLPLAVLLKITASIAVASLSYYAYERHFLKLKKHFEHGGTIIAGDKAAVAA